MNRHLGEIKTSKIMKTSEQSLPGGSSRAKTPAMEKLELPKLRKNRKYELKWGSEYFNKLKEAVFMVDPQPHVPAEIPGKFRGVDDKEDALHVCKHCNDSFRFKSSLDIHENRKSFILGYWCYHCFHVNCTHTQEERSMCLLCQNIENKNRARLSRRGLKRGQKMGSVQVFYNQCQFFAHLKLHSEKTVDVAYIMLMPIPSEFDNSEESHLLEACKAIMEYAFVKQKHVVDVLGTLNHNSKWWMSEPSDDTLIGELLKKYLIDSGDEFAENWDQETASRAVSPTPTDMTDITFVDCGPSPKVFRAAKPKAPSAPQKPKVVISPPKATVSPPKPKAVISPPKGTMSPPKMTSVLKAPLAKFSDIPTLESLKKSLSAQQKILGDRGTLNNEIPPEVPKILNKTAIIKKDGITTSILLSTSTDKNTTSIAGAAKTFVTPSIPVPVLSNITKLPEKMIKLPPGGKLVIQNGKKYIIRTIPSGNLVAKETPKPVPNNVRVQAPIPPPPQPKIPQFLIPALKNRKIHLPRNVLASEFQHNVNLSNLELGARGLEGLLTKYKLDFRKKLLNYSNQRIQIIVESVTEFCKEFAKAGFADSPALIKTNSNALKQIKGYLETGTNEVMSPLDQRVNNEYKNRLTSWEYPKNSYDICASCLKKEKPKKYMIGISKPAKPEEDYCQCYNFICHLCKARQGNAKKFQEHLKFHNSRAPFKCPECFTVFGNMQSLEMHIWTKCFHLYTQEIFACRVCEIEGFLTMEALSRHYHEVHSRSVVVCPRCPVSSSSYAEHLQHHAKDHTGVAQTEDPEYLIICDFGGCLVSPENFHLHMESHREIGRIQYYTCPFCAFFKKNVVGNEHAIQDHVFMNHSDRLREIITPETLNFFASHFNLRVDPIRPKGKEMIVPKIVNACSIAPTAFDQVSSQNKTTSKIIKVNTSSDSLIPRVSTGGTIPRIVNVQSMNSGVNQAVNNSGNPKPKYQIQALQSGKLVSVPLSYLTNNLSHQRPIMLKLNLVDKNSNQVDDKKAPATSSVIPKVPESVPVTLTTPKASEITSPTLTTTKIASSTLISPKIASSTPKNASSTETTPKNASSTETTPKNASSTVTTPKSAESVLSLPATPVTSFSETPQLSPSTGLFHDQQPPPSAEEPTAATSIPEVEPEKMIVESENPEGPEVLNEVEQSEIDDIVAMPPPNRELSLEERNEILRESEEALKRRGRPKKPWRIALDGSDDSNHQPLNFKCHLCHENITTAWEVIKHHFAVRHFREYKLCVVSPRLEKIPHSEELEAKLEECKKRKIETTSPRGASRRKRRVGMTKIEDNSHSGICVTQEKLEQIEGNFKCKKCEELFEDVKMLREHFANKHRIKGHFLVCLECGENFVVANSLQMHLKAFHGILDTVSYLAQNSLYAPDIGGSLDARVTEPNQCYVCMAVFEDKHAVDKHLRVHGMAFLNHTRSEARNAPKPDDKKTEVWKKPDVGRQINQQIGDNEAKGESILTRITMLLS